MKKISIIFLLIFVLLVGCTNNEKIIIDFETNGGTEISSILVDKNTEFNIPETTKEGYEFVGWFTEETFENKFLGSADKNLKLYAKWEEIPLEYIIEFKNVELENVKVKTGETLVRPENPVKEGFIFKGWFTDEELTLQYDFTLAVESDLVLYAKFDEEVIVEFTVEFKNVDVDSVKVKENEKLVKPADPEKEGYNFVGWFIDDAYENEYNFENVLTSNLILYAKFEEIYCNIYFVDTDFENLVVKYGEVVEIPVPEKEGYKFIGWSTDPLVVVSDNKLIVKKDYILTAKWEEIVTIKSLNAEVIEEIENEIQEVSTYNTRTLSMKRLSKRSVIPSGQYIVMYKSEVDIKFTITLNNAKGESIDAIQLTCDDPDSKVLVDGKYVNIQFDENNSRIINWAQEDPYQKTYYIQTTSQTDINTIRVVDLKVNGEWQGVELSQDELKIYKLNENDLVWNFVKNTFTEYVWNFSTEECITNLVVSMDGETVAADENGNYTITKNGKVEYEYDYTYEGVTLHWKDSREIKLLEIEYVPGIDGGGWGWIQPFNPDCSWLMFYVIEGTDIYKEKITVEYLGVKYKFILKHGEQFDYYLYYGEWPVDRMTYEDYRITYVYLGGEKYKLWNIFKR